MIIVMRHDASAKQIAKVVAKVESRGLRVNISRGEERTIIGVIGDDRPDRRHPVRAAGRRGEDRADPQAVQAGLARDAPDGHAGAAGRHEGRRAKIAIIAGPCSVESREQILETASRSRRPGRWRCAAARSSRARSPYSFRGMGEKGLELLAEAREATGLPIVTEVMTPEQVRRWWRATPTCIQIGARNMQNLRAARTSVGECGRPVLLKRGLMATIEELLMSAEYIMAQGNSRGDPVRARHPHLRERHAQHAWTINAIPVLKQLTHLPVIVDPSHGTGKWES